MAQKTDFNQLLGQHGDKATILLAALAFLVFGIMALTAGTPSMSIDSFESKVKQERDRVSKNDAPAIPVREYSKMVVDALGSETQNPPDTVIAAEATKPTVAVNVMVKTIGEVQPPASGLTLVSASKGSAIIRWTTTKHPECKSYKIKWWKTDEEDEPEWNAPDKSATLSQTPADFLEFEIKGLMDNTPYTVAVRSWGPLTALDFKGATPSTEGPDNKGLRIPVVSKGDTKSVPNPTNATVVSASLEGVRLQWDSPRSAFADDPAGYVAEAEVRVLVWRWFGNDLSTKILLTPIDGAHPGGWTLADMDAIGWAMTDTNLRPETEIHYGVQFFHLEAFPDPANPGLSVDKKGKTIKDKSYSGEEITIELSKRKRSGEWDVEEGTAGPVLKSGTEPRRVYASRMMLFDMNAVGGRVYLANKAIFKCTKVSNSNPSIPNFAATSDGRLEVTKYFLVRDVASAQPVWRAFTAEFNLKVGDIVGSLERPEKMNGEKLDRNSPWKDVVELDPRTNQPKPNQSAGKLDFATPFRVKGIYVVPYPTGNIKLNYIALCDAAEFDAANDAGKAKLKEFKIYLDKDLEKEAYLANAPRALTQPATKEEWLAAYRAYIQEVVLPAEQLVASQNGGQFNRARMKDKLEAAMYATDGDQLMLKFSVKYGIRGYSTEMIRNLGGQTSNLNEIEYVRMEAEKMISDEWSSLKGRLSNSAQNNVPDDIKTFVMMPGNDDIAMADLVKAIDASKGKPFAVAVWKLVIGVLADRGRSIKPELTRIGDADVERIAVVLPDLKSELERYYDLNRR